ncbi:MAG: hypothetical protein D6708_16265, partial [Candidatus Dadabacteria bacterium]
MMRFERWLWRAGVAGAVALSVAAPAWAGYRALDREWEGYEPGEFYRAQLASTPPERPQTAGDGAFEAQKARLEEARRRWAEALEAGLPGERFYEPAPEVLERVRAAADDPGKAQALLADGFDLETLEALAWVRNPGIRAAED